MSWRPENWPIYGRAVTVWIDGKPTEISTTLQRAFEAGADAMLEALKSRVDPIGGIWIFIPDEDKK